MIRLRTVSDDKNAKLLEDINRVNALRYNIKVKKRTLSKMANVPEMVDEYNALKNEISELEKQL